MTSRVTSQAKCKQTACAYWISKRACSAEGLLKCGAMRDRWQCLNYTLCGSYMKYNNMNLLISNHQLFHRWSTLFPYKIIVYSHSAKVVYKFPVFATLIFCKWKNGSGLWIESCKTSSQVISNSVQQLLELFYSNSTSPRGELSSEYY